MALVVNGRGAFLPYFDKRSEKRTYFPQELKIRDYQGFPAGNGIQKREMERIWGLFALRLHTP